MDKCARCVDNAINKNEPFDIDDIPVAVMGIPHFQMFGTVQGQVGGICTIRVCLNCRKKELNPSKVQAVQGVLLQPPGKNSGR